MSKPVTNFAQRLRSLRKIAGLTQEQLAHACGWSGQSRVANYEAEGSGARQPSIEEIPVLAKALGVTIDVLFGLSEQVALANSPALTHLDSSGRPAMVDVSTKTITARAAVATTRVRFPKDIANALRAQGMASAKGPVEDTAIIAGTMAVKRTSEIIPFCHPLPIDGCRIAVEWTDANTLEIRCEVRTMHRTGVEMEALTGASVAALTVYDMCKALTHAIVIGPTRLVGKRGGKRDVGEVG